MDVVQREAAVTRLRVLLEKLHDRLLLVRSDEQLLDEMAEGGSILYQGISTGIWKFRNRLAPDSIEDFKRDYREGLKTGKYKQGTSYLSAFEKIYFRLHYSEPKRRAQKYLDEDYRWLFLDFIGIFSNRNRYVLRPSQEPCLDEAPMKAGFGTTYVHSFTGDEGHCNWESDEAPMKKGMGTMSFYSSYTGDKGYCNWEQDYELQGRRFAMFVQELLADLSTRKAATKPPEAPEQKSLSVSELEPEVAQVVATVGRKQYISADIIAALIIAAGKKTSAAQVKNTDAHKYYVEKKGKGRKRAATLTNADDVLQGLVNNNHEVQRSKGRRIKKSIERSHD